MGQDGLGIFERAAEVNAKLHFVLTLEGDLDMSKDITADLADLKSIEAGITALQNLVTNSVSPTDWAKAQAEIATLKTMLAAATGGNPQG